MVLELILYRFFSLLNNFFFSTSFLLKINHPIINHLNHFSIVSILHHFTNVARKHFFVIHFPSIHSLGKEIIRSNEIIVPQRQTTRKLNGRDRNRPSPAIQDSHDGAGILYEGNVINLLRVRSSVRFLTIQ